MPQFIYKPDVDDKESWKSWDFDPGKLVSPERIAIEKMTGMTWGQWKQAVRQESTIAIEALLFVLLKRETPTLKPAQTPEFTEEQVTIDISDAEAATYLRELLATDDRDADTEAAIAALRQQLALSELDEQFGAPVESPGVVYDPEDADPKDEPATT